MELPISAEMQEDLFRQLGSSKALFHGLKLRSLDKLLRSHEELTLKAYLVWLHGRFLAKTAHSSHDSMPLFRSTYLQSWCQRIQNFGLDRQRVFNALCDWNAAQLRLNPDAVDSEHIKTVEKELEAILFRGAKAAKAAKAAKKHRDLDHPGDLDHPAQALLRYTDLPSRSSQYNVSVIERPEIIGISSETDDGEYNLSAHHGPNGNRDNENIAKQPPSQIMVSDGSSSEQHDAAISACQAGTYGGGMTNDDRSSALQSHLQHINVARQALLDGLAEPRQLRQQPQQAGPDCKEESPFAVYNLSMKPRRPLPTNYVCYRCEVPGHFLAFCPTNLDPAYDRPPRGNYMCAVCKKLKDHVTSLCPENTDPSSLTQLRLRYGTVRSKSLQKLDEPSPGYFKAAAHGGDQRAQVSGVLAGDPMHEARRRTTMEIEHDQTTKEHSYESRNSHGRRSYSRTRSLQASPDYGHESNDVFPLPKRSRIDDQEQGRGRARDDARRQEHDTDAWPLRGVGADRFRSLSPDDDEKRRRSRGCDSTHNDVRGASRIGKYHVRLVSPSVDRDNDSYQLNIDLLPSMKGRKVDPGRLSYWDSEYHSGYPTLQALKNTPPSCKRHNFSSSPSSPEKQFPTENLQFASSRAQEIKRLHPHADPVWAWKMATFDTDLFLSEVLSSVFPGPSDKGAALRKMDTTQKRSFGDVCTPRHSSPCISPCASFYPQDRSQDEQCCMSFVENTLEEIEGAEQDRRAGSGGGRRSVSVGAGDSGAPIPANASPQERVSDVF